MVTLNERHTAAGRAGLDEAAQGIKEEGVAGNGHSYLARRVGLGRGVALFRSIDGVRVKVSTLGN